ncbi:MAG: hypothetical protein FRX49_02632 [Trebouxia sp. A1-2]|nr:MAG: hypothetical protein FRX49_02632 [Trebouxia sp. A1-2]
MIILPFTELSWLALQQKVLSAKWDVAAKDDAALLRPKRACPKGNVWWRMQMSRHTYEIKCSPWFSDQHPDNIYILLKSKKLLQLNQAP